MREEQIQSVAFRNAELGSERLRIFGVVGFFAIFMLITVVRVFVIRTVSGTALWLWTLILAVVVIGYELWMLSKVQRALRAGAMFSCRLCVLSTIVETSIPAFAIAFLESRRCERSRDRTRTTGVGVPRLCAVKFQRRARSSNSAGANQSGARGRSPEWSLRNLRGCGLLSKVLRCRDALCGPWSPLYL
jgi:hypothetical protein